MIAGPAASSGKVVVALRERGNEASECVGCDASHI